MRIAVDPWGVKGLENTTSETVEELSRARRAIANALSSVLGASGSSADAVATELARLRDEFMADTAKASEIVVAVNTSLGEATRAFVTYEVSVSDELAALHRLLDN